MTDPKDEPAPGAQPPGPVPPQSGQGQPGPQEAGHQQPGYQQPGYQQPGYQQPGYQQPGYQQPGSPYPGTPGGPGVPPAGGGASAPKPGVIPLRPLGVGEILDGAISYIRANPMATLGLAAIVVTIAQLLQLPASAVALNQLPGLAGEPTPAGIASALVAAMTSSLLAWLVTFVATTVLSGMLIAVLSQAVLGRKMRIGEAWTAVRPRIPGLIGLTLLVTLLLGLVLVIGIAPVVIAAIADAPGVAVLLGVVFMLASWGVALFFGVSWSLAAPAYVLEGVGVTDALRRSFRLVRKQWWRVFGILLLGGIIAAVISWILSLPFVFAANATVGAPDPADPFGGISMLGLVISSVGAIIATTVTAPFSAGISGLLYLDQRIRREALDIELARAAQQ